MIDWWNLLWFLFVCLFAATVVGTLDLTSPAMPLVAFAVGVGAATVFPPIKRR